MIEKMKKKCGTIGGFDAMEFVYKINEIIEVINKLKNSQDN